MESLQLICQCCKTKQVYENSILAWEEGWSLDGEKVCPTCIEKNENISNIGFTQPCGLGGARVDGVLDPVPV